ncbi:MAG: hypothetical protein LBB22_01745 [Treponema sp.]|nr:hypothetical protein [Treponema sp.]
MKMTVLGAMVLLFVVSALAVAQQKPPAGATVSATDAASKVSSGWVLVKGAASVFIINDGAAEATVTYSVEGVNEAPAKVAAGKTQTVAYKGKGYKDGKGVIKIVKVEAAAAAAAKPAAAAPAAAPAAPAAAPAPAKK